MAKLAGIIIADKNSKLGSGGAFLLAQKCKISKIVKLDTGWEVEVNSQSPYIVARGPNAINASTAFDLALEAAQQGLDFLSILGESDLSIREANSECLLWWREGTLQVLRSIFVIPFSIIISSAITQYDKSGKMIPQPSIPQPTYHECLRYFRLSQTTDDLFDAYRNMWLSFELLLSKKVPRGHKGEGEGEWLKRALKEINKTIPLTNIYKPNGKNVVKAIYKEQYEGIRCNLFHAKEGKKPLIPGSPADRKKVNVALAKLTHLVLLLAKHELKVRRGGGAMTYEGFDLSIVLLMSKYEMIVSDSYSRSKINDDRTSVKNLPHVPLVTNHESKLSSPGLQFVLGTTTLDRLNSLRNIARLDIFIGDKLLMSRIFEAELTYEYIDRFEVLVGWQLINLAQPKYHFKL